MPVAPNRMTFMRASVARIQRARAIAHASSRYSPRAMTAWVTASAVEITGASRPTHGSPPK
jgi:hypothetical protein